MVNKILITCTLFVGHSYADWIDDVAASNKQEISVNKAMSIVDGYIKQDKKALAEIDKKIENNHDGAGMETIHAGAYKVQHKTAEVELQYHEKVRDFLKALLENKKDRIAFSDRVKAIQEYTSKIKALEKEKTGAGSAAHRTKLAAQITLEQAKIKATKVAIDGSLLTN